MVDMTDLLSRPASDAKPPEQLPPGDWIFQITGVKSDRKSQNGNLMVDFEVSAIQPVDLSPDQLGGVEIPYSMRYTQTVTEKSRYRLVDFLRDTLKIEIPEGVSTGSLLPQAVGRTFRGSVVLSPSNKPGDNRMYSNIQSVYPT